MPDDASAPDAVAAVAALRQVFLSNFGGDPHTIVRAPGRVNLIGEHIDYNGYSVLPIAIEQSVYVAIAPNTDSKIRIVNHDPGFEPLSCAINDVGKINKPPSWHDYLLCGLYGVHEHLHVPLTTGVNMALLGKIPPAAGLSSSSALVCGAALAGLALFGGNRAGRNGDRKDETEHLVQGKIEESVKKSRENECGNEGDKKATGNGVGSTHLPDSAPSLHGPSLHGVSFKELAHICAVAEKYVGTQGGGMDQAASLLSERGRAQLISFHPLRCESVMLPPGASFVVANCLATANKAATADFNQRVAECRLATAVLAVNNGLPWREVANMADLQKQLGLAFDRMVAMVEAMLHEDPYTLNEVAGVLEASPSEVASALLPPHTRDASSFCLRPRALHVFSEAGRVEAFRRTCLLWEEGRAQGSLEDTLQTLGALLEESHASLRDLYNCSHPLLDELVQLSSKHGLGGRLTGAGWGGCMVALVPKAAVRQHCGHLYDSYYKSRGVAEDALGNVLFSSAPAGGAEVLWAAGDKEP